MTRKKIEKIPIFHRREINWLKWYFLKDEQNTTRTILEQKIHNAFLSNDLDYAAYLVNIKTTTEDYLKECDKAILKAVKEVYVYEKMNISDACVKFLCKPHLLVYPDMTDWFDNYYRSTFKYVIASNFSF